MKIFWSWQSDTPGKIGRFFIRDAIKDAIEHLQQTLDIEEPAARENLEALHLDQDIQNVPGSPDLARTILDKIDISEVVVADVTLTGKVPDSTGQDDKIIAGKKLINSNVAIELGYALHALTDQRVLMVFNEYYGTHTDLPFDLRHKGGAIVFNLPPDADSQHIKTERKKLKETFVQRLKPYLNERLVAPDPFPETPSTYSKAAYFDLMETLARVGTPDFDEARYDYETDALCYLRLIPVTKLSRTIPLADLNSVAQRAPLLARDRSPLGCLNKYGAIGYLPGGIKPGTVNNLKASTQLFQNGEIWAISASLIFSERNGYPDWVKLPHLPCNFFESRYIQCLRELIEFAKDSLGLRAPWYIELGVVGVKGLYLGVANHEQWGPIHKQEIIRRERLNDENPNSVNAILLKFFTEVIDASGHRRPENLNDFPSVNAK